LKLLFIGGENKVDIKSLKPAYQKPKVIDILNSGFLGAKPLATCSAGTNPKNACNLGLAFNASTN